MPPKRSRAGTAAQADAPSSKRVKETPPISTSAKWTKDTVAQLSYDELRQALKVFGENPGPISDATRPMYERMLLKRQQEEESASKAAATAAAAGPAPLIPSVLSPSKGNTSPVGHHSATSKLTAAKEAAASKSSIFGSSWTASPRAGSSAATSSSSSVSKSRTAVPTTVSSNRGSAKSTISAKTTRGLVAATYTPLSPSGDINLDVIDQYADFLVQGGVTGVFVNGTTGEGVKFSVDERKDLVEKWIEAARGKLSVFVHVGAESIKDAQEMAIHAHENHADAIAVIAPTMFKPKTADHMVDYCSAVALAAPSIPLYFYHIPPLTETKFSIEDFLDSAVRRIPSFAGVKYSDCDLAQFGACRFHGNGDLHMMYGCDQQLLAALAMGANTFVGSTYNLYPKLYHAIASAFEKGQHEEARRLQLISWQVVRVLLRFGGVIPAGRCLLDHLGITVGPPRVPDRAPDNASVKMMLQELQDMDFFSWV